LPPVATSTLATYCQNNFATTTNGIFSQLTADIQLGLCNVGTFLFVPSQNTLQNFSNLQSNVTKKIPFSYYYEIRNIVASSTATTTTNMQSFAIDLNQLNFASSTAMGNILPTVNFDFLSKETIDHFLPTGMHDLLYNLMQFAIWIELMWLLYHKVVPTKAKI
jgi:hypothetical protein